MQGKKTGDAEMKEEYDDPRLKGVEPQMIELICNQIIDHAAPVTWDQIAGLSEVKKSILEIVVWCAYSDTPHTLSPPTRLTQHLGRCCVQTSSMAYAHLRAVCSCSVRLAREKRSSARPWHTVASRHSSASLRVH